MLASAQEDPTGQSADTTGPRGVTGKNEALEFSLEFPAGMLQGESQVVLGAPANTTKVIQLTSFSLTAQSTSVGPGAGNGKSVPLTLQIGKLLNADSSALLAMIHTAQHFDSLILHVRRKGAAVDNVTYTLNTVFITSMTTSGDGMHNTIQETIELAVGAVTAQVPT